MIRQTLNPDKEELDVLMALAMDTGMLRTQGKKMRMYFLALAAISLFLGLLGHEAIGYIAAVIFFIFALAGIRPFQKLILKSNYKRADQRLIYGQREYVISEEGIEITSYMGTGLTKWGGFTACGEYSHYFWFRRSDNQTVLIDKNKMTEAEIAELTGYMSKVGIMQ